MPHETCWKSIMRTVTKILSLFWELCGPNPKFHIHVSVSDLPILLEKNMWTDPATI